MVRVEGGEFLMGTEDPDGFAADGEGPVRAVTLKPFWIDAYVVTNTQFATFVEATGHVTDAERYGWSFVFGGLLPDDFEPPRGARLLERRGLLLRVVGDEATHRGRVGVCSPWRA
jgi:formylglycine-generating enzyme